ncbi:hypothetical protein ASF36_13455 [Methylobacterium sp. Leaf90]|nr:hypothetical protein ASF36_13455 [Methylobacterium sp. Leaf90]
MRTIALVMLGPQSPAPASAGSGFRSAQRELPELKFWKLPLRAALFAPRSRPAASSNGPAWSLAFGLSRRAVPRYLVK